MKRVFYSFLILCTFLLSACKSNDIPQLQQNISSSSADIKTQSLNDNSITLLFGGDIMAHEVNYNISSYDKIWEDVKDVISSADLSFANIESPIDTTKEVSSYPKFNMNQAYVEEAVNAGFNVFSLCNNHTNDKDLQGIKETEKTMAKIAAAAKENNKNIYYSGLRVNNEENFTYNVINCKSWKIVFLPVTEILNQMTFTSYINYQPPDHNARKKLFKYIKEIKLKEKCDLFILSLHTYEPEYIRTVSEDQENYYKELLDVGVDIIMANHTHLIKDRKVVVDTTTNSDKLIMYANGNVISGQRKKPDFISEYPDFERDNTGDGLLYKVTLTKDENGRIEILKADPFFITTYINTDYEFIIKKMDDNFVNYLYDIGRIDWAKYIQKRMRVNKKETKDLIEWR